LFCHLDDGFGDFIGGPSGSSKSIIPQPSDQMQNVLPGHQVSVTSVNTAQTSQPVPAVSTQTTSATQKIPEDGTQNASDVSAHNISANQHESSHSGPSVTNDQKKGLLMSSVYSYISVCIHSFKYMSEYIYISKHTHVYPLTFQNTL